MSTATADQSPSPFLVAAEKTTKLDQFVQRFSEWCSSILVKETRQALKSRQFVWTFFALMTLVATWSFFALSQTQSDGTLPRDVGSTMLIGYLWILGAPLCIIIPFTTYRSLAQEFEDGTIQMVLITTMKPWQIVAGKLGSAMLQMMVYLSVIAPCVAFCYLLRGVDVPMLMFWLLTAVLVSIGLCAVALMLGSL